MKCTFLLENHDAFRQALAAVLNREPDMETGGQAKTLQEARRCVEDHIEEIDIAVVGLMLPDGAGVDLIREMHQHRPELPVLVVTMVRERVVHDWVRSMGATEILTKDASLEQIIGAIRRLGGE